MLFTTEPAPMRQLMARYAAWIMDQFPGDKSEAAKFLRITRPTLDQLLKKADHYARPKPRQD